MSDTLIENAPHTGTLHPADYTVYLAGPMTGHPQFNFPAFDKAAELLRLCGWDVVSPAELDDPETRAAALASPNGAPGSGTANGESWGDFLSRDVKLIADGVGAVVLMDGWETSRGARLEGFVAAISGKPIGRFNPSNTWGITWETIEWFRSRLNKSLADSPEPCWPMPSFVASAPPLRKMEEDLILGSSGGLPTADPTAELKRRQPPSCARVIEDIKLDHVSLNAEPGPGGEVRVTNETTGGQKGTKAQQMELLPWGQLAEVSEHYHKGAEKYAAHNWKRGYAWSLSFGALQRHAALFWEGEDFDAETGTSHLSAIVFHALALLYFRDNFPELDDRFATTGPGEAD